MLSLLFLPLEMNICNKPSNKTAPEKSVWTAPTQASGPSPELQGQRSRRNGWSWPPHPLQIVAWLLYLFFAVIGFGVLVPLLPHHWVPAGYAVSLGECQARVWDCGGSGWSTWQRSEGGLQSLRGHRQVLSPPRWARGPAAYLPGLGRHVAPLPDAVSLQTKVPRSI